jgi:27-O-demethylrifamycin SV methyltransferase
MSRVINALRVLAGVDAVKKTQAYYTLFGDLFDAASQGSGFYNLGLWDTADTRWPDAQLALLNHVANHLPTQGHLLDVGCGVGGPAFQLTKSRPQVQVTGVNVVEQQLTRARQRGNDRVCFLWADADELPFRPGSMDGLYSIESAFQFRDRGQFAHQAAKVLRPGAPLVITDLVNRPESRRLYDRFVLRAAEIGLGSGGLGTQEEWRHHLERHGFQDIVIEDLWPRVLPGLTRWAEMLEGTLMPTTYPKPMLNRVAKGLRYVHGRGLQSPLGYILIRGTRGD